MRAGRRSTRLLRDDRARDGTIARKGARSLGTSGSRPDIQAGDAARPANGPRTASDIPASATIRAGNSSPLAGEPQADDEARAPIAARGDGPIWHNRHFMLLWAAQAIGQTANNAVNYGLLVLVQTQSQSATHMSFAVLTVVLPSVLFGLVAGAYVDRQDKRLVMMVTNLLRAALMPLYALFPHWLLSLLVVNFLFSTISQFFAPAESAMIPSLVRRSQLLQANSLFHITFTASQLGGFVLLGPLVVGLFGIGGLFGTVAAALVISAMLLWPLPSTYRRVDDQIEGFRALWAEVVFVLRYIRSDRAIAWAVGLWTFGSTLVLVVATLAPTFVVRVLGVRAEDSVFVLAPAGIGTVVGSVVLGRWGGALDRRRLIEGALLTLGLLIGLLALVPSIWTWLGWIVPAESGDPAVLGWRTLIGSVMALAALAGFAFVSVIVPSQALIQERARPDVLGRLFAVQMVIGNVLSILPLVALGEIADTVGVDWTLLLVGGLVLIAGLLSIALARLNVGMLPLAERPDRRVY